MKHFLVFLITAYQAALSPETGVLPRVLGLSRPTCAFYPSCSAYAKESIQRHGVWKGVVRAGRRIFSCRPSSTPSLWLVE